MEIWLPPLPGKQYLVAVDPAGGGSEGDYSAVEVLEMETGLQCAEFAGHVGGLELAQLVTGIAVEYNQAWLVVERNNHGSGVLALTETVCRYARIYRPDGQGRMADHVGEQPGGARTPGRGLVGAAGALHEQAAAGGVPKLCAAAGREDGSAGGHARRPGDGHGDRAWGAGGTAAGAKVLELVTYQAAVVIQLRSDRLIATDRSASRHTVQLEYLEDRRGAAWRFWRCSTSGGCGAAHRGS